MYQNQNEKFGLFIAELRREKNMTQKELAERLYVSDKAVSKWERGLSMPNVSLLLPLADVLGVSVTELLKGERIEEGSRLDIREVDALITHSVGLSAERKQDWDAKTQRWKWIFGICLVIASAEITALICWLKVPVTEMLSTVFMVTPMMLLFGAWACFAMKPVLPSYYDQDKISFVQQGLFKISMAGIVYFNNRNWPHIVNALRAGTLAPSVLYPPVFYGIYRFLGPAMGENGASAATFVQLPVELAACLSFFIPVIWLAKKYE